MKSGEKTISILRFKEYKLAVIVFTVLFSFNQLLPVSFANWEPSSEPALKSHVATQSIEDASQDITLEASQSSDQKTEVSQVFMTSELKLEKADQEETFKEEKTKKDEAPKEQGRNYDVDEYTFDDAVAQLSEDYASAVIVKNISKDDLKKLVELKIEVGIAIIEKKIVLFTSGSGEEIRVNPVAKELLAQADLIIHTHPAGHDAKPSLHDIELAGSAIEYVLGTDGVYAYNKDGLVTSEASDYSILVKLLNSMKNNSVSSSAAREKLNTFIAAIDVYNSTPENTELFRSAPPTPMPGTPVVGGFNSDPAFGQPLGVVNINQTSSSQFTIGYDVTNNGSFVGGVISFPTPQNLSTLTYLSFELRTDNPTCLSAPCTKIEIKDANGKAGAFTINNLNSTFKQIDIPIVLFKGTFPDVDLTKVKEIVFVVDHGMAVSKPNGYLEVKTGGGLKFTPTLPGTAYNPSAVINLPGTPAVASIKGAAGSGTIDGTITINQTNNTRFSMNYNLADNDDFVVGQISYGYFDDGGIFQGAARDLRSFTLAMDGPAGKQAKVEILDKNGKKAEFYVTLQGSFRNYFFDLSGQNIPAGFNVTKIAMINIVMDKTKSGASGTITVEAKGLAYMPTLNSDPSQTPDKITKLPITSTGSRPVLTGFAKVGDGSTTKVTQSSQTFFQLEYTGATKDSFGGAFVSYDNLSTTGTIETLDFTTAFPTGLVLQVDSPNGATEAVLEFKDNAGNVARVRLAGIEAFGKRWLIRSTDLFNVNLRKIQTISLVMIGQKTASRINVDWGNFDYTAKAVAGAYNAGALTALPNQPVVAKISGSTQGDAQANGTITINQTSTKDVAFAYTIADDNDFVVGQISNGYFDANGIFQGTPANIGNNLVMAMSGPAGKIVTVEVVDRNGKVAKYEVTLGAAKQNYTMNLSGANVPTGFRNDRIAYINIVMNQKNAGAAGTLNVEAPGLAFTPNATIAPYNAGALTSLPGQPVVAKINGSTAGAAEADGTITVNQTSPNDVAFNYTLNDNDDFVVGQVSYGYFDNNGIFVGTARDLRTFTMAMTGPAGKEVIVEVMDKNGKVAKFSVKTDGTKKNVTFPLTVANIPAGFNISKIAMINFVMIKEKAGASGTLTIETRGLAFTPPATVAAYNAAALSILPANPSVAKINGSTLGEAQANGTITINQSSRNDVVFNYTLADDNDFVVGQISYGYFDQTGVFHGAAQDVRTFTMAMTGPAGKEVIAEVVDWTGKIAKFVVKLEGSKKNYTFNLSGANIPAGFNITKIALINFVMDKTRSGASGALTIETRGLDYIANANSTAYNSFGVSTLVNNPVVSTIVGSIAGESESDGTITPTQTSPNTVDFDYTLADSDDFVVGQLSYGYFNDEGIFQGTPGNLGSSFTMALQGPAGKEYTLEVVDRNGKMAKFSIKTDGTKRNYTFNLTGSNIPAGFRTDRIVWMNIAMDRAKAGASGKLTLEVKGIKVIPPVPTVNPDPNSGPDKITRLPKLSSGLRPAITGFASQDGSTTAVQQFSTTFTQFTYTGAKTSSFGGVFVNYDNPNTVAAETLDFAAAFPAGLILQLDSSDKSVSEVLLELKDRDGNVSSVKLAGIDNFGQRWKILPSQFTGLNMNKITTISLVLTGQKTNGKLSVDWGVFDYVAPAPAAAFNTASHTVLESPNKPSLGKIDGSSLGDTEADGTIAGKQTSASHVEFDYTLADDDDFVVGQIGYGYFDANGVFQGTPGNIGNNLVLGVNGPAGKEFIVEVMDTQGNLAKFSVKTDGTGKNYTLNLAGGNVPAGFRNDRIAFINIVMTKSKAGNAGKLIIDTKGLRFEPGLEGVVFF